MSNQPIEDLLPKADWSIYRLVRMAANRTTELADGKPSLIEKPNSDKLTTIALDEIAQGKVVYKEVADQIIQAEEFSTGSDEIDEA